MKVSNCCGASGNKIWLTVSEDDVITFHDIEICYECREHCDYVEEEKRFDDIPDNLFKNTNDETI
jgi:hypothetical protein